MPASPKETSNPHPACRNEARLPHARCRVRRPFSGGLEISAQGIERPISKKQNNNYRYMGESQVG
jgi:hypothetical protein